MLNWLRLLHTSQLAYSQLVSRSHPPTLREWGWVRKIRVWLGPTGDYSVHSPRSFAKLTWGWARTQPPTRAAIVPERGDGKRRDSLDQVRSGPAIVPFSQTLSSSFRARFKDAYCFRLQNCRSVTFWYVRIRIRGSVPLTIGSGLRSLLFSFLTSEGRYIDIIFLIKKSQKEGIKVFLTSFAWSGSMRPKNIRPQHC